MDKTEHNNGAVGAPDAPVPISSARDLLRLMAAGDTAALAAFYDALAPRVRGMARFLLGDADDADDVVEETFWQAWRTAGTYDGDRASPATWLLMIARTRALDRSRARRRRSECEGAVGAVGDDSEFGGERPDAFEFHPGLAQALDTLPQNQRDVIHLAFVEGCPHSEIARRTGAPLGTVKTRLRLAMTQLRRRLVPEIRTDVDA